MARPLTFRSGLGAFLGGAGRTIGGGAQLAIQRQLESQRAEEDLRRKLGARLALTGEIEGQPIPAADVLGTASLLGLPQEQLQERLAPLAGVGQEALVQAIMRPPTPFEEAPAEEAFPAGALSILPERRPEAISKVLRLPSRKELEKKKKPGKSPAIDEAFIRSARAAGVLDESFNLRPVPPERAASIMALMNNRFQVDRGTPMTAAEIREVQALIQQPGLPGDVNPTTYWKQVGDLLKQREEILKGTPEGREPGMEAEAPKKTRKERAEDLKRAALGAAGFAGQILPGGRRF